MQRVTYTDGSTEVLHVFACVLGYSRYRVVEVYERADLPHLLQGHIAAFHAVGGVPAELLYDNLRSVVKRRRGTEVTFQEAFLAFASHYGFVPRACWPYRPETKGKVERLIQFVERDFFLGRLFRDRAGLRTQLAAWCAAVNARPHGTTGLPPVQRWAQERPHLLPLPAGGLDVTPVETRRVSRDCLVHYGGNRYLSTIIEKGATWMIEKSSHQVFGV